MSILIFFIVLFVLILVHEWGHFIVAKKTGMRVDEFGIGFPPKLFGVKKGETEYTFNALPIGGFVKIWGENYGSDDESEMIDKDRAFAARPKWAQIAVLLAGVTMNILFAWFLFALTFMIGVPTEVTEEQATDDAELIVYQVLSDGPAADVVAPGITVTAVTSGDQVIPELTPSALTAFVDAVAPEPVTLQYEQSGEVKEVTVTPQQGLVAEDPDRYLIGVRPALVEDQSVGPVTALWQAATHTVDVVVAITVGLFTLLGQSIAGTADYSQVAGPIGIVDMVGDAASFGLVALLSFTAFISLNLAVINLLPIPALDGGRVVFVLYEAITGKTIPTNIAGHMILIGFALLMLLMIAVTFNDIVRLIS